MYRLFLFIVDIRGSFLLIFVIFFRKKKIILEENYKIFGGNIEKNMIKYQSGINK